MGNVGEHNGKHLYLRTDHADLNHGGLTMTDPEKWPALPYAEWAATKKTLHMCTQMLGKTRLALTPPQPEWLHARLFLDGHGFTTGPMPFRGETLTVAIDLFDSKLKIRKSDGGRIVIPIADGRCVADIWDDYVRSLAKLGVEVDLWEKPQETADTTPFSENTHDCTIIPEHARRFHTVLSSVYGPFEEFRSRFFGRSGVQFWWGTFDEAVLLFTGKKVEAPEDKGYIMRYDLDAEHMNAGFWPGDDDSPEAIFYAYLVPPPPACETAPVKPPHANWVEAMGEWILPYEAVRTADDPRQAILEFLDSVYQAARSLGGWDSESFAYTPPPPSARPSRG